MTDSSEWMLKPSMFVDLNRVWIPFEIDLFASRNNAQHPTYISWRTDPFATAVDAFQIQWNMKGTYAFPPFSMIPRVLVLAKFCKDSITGVLITPTWQNQAWVPCVTTHVNRPANHVPRDNGSVTK